DGAVVRGTAVEVVPGTGPVVVMLVRFHFSDQNRVRQAVRDARHLDHGHADSAENAPQIANGPHIAVVGTGLDSGEGASHAIRLIVISAAASGSALRSQAAGVVRGFVVTDAVARTLQDLDFHVVPLIHQRGTDQG